MAQARRSGWRPRLGPTFAVVLAALMLLSAALVGAIAYRAHAGSMLAFSRELIQHNAELVREQVDRFLVPTRQAAELALALLEHQLIRVEQLDDIEAYFFDFLSVHLDVASLAWGDERGRFLMVRRQPDGALWTKRIDLAGGVRQVLWARRQPGGPLAPAELHPDPADAYDPRTRPWYVGAREQGGLYWTDVYVFHTGGLPGITAALPVAPGGHGAPAGVLSVDVSLLDLSHFVGRMRVGQSGHAFILDHRGRLIAWPHQDAGALAPPPAATGGHAPHGARLLHIRECPSPAVAHLGTLPEVVGLLQRSGQPAGPATAPAGTTVAYRAAGSRWVAALKPITIDPARPWLVGVIALEDEFLASARAATVHSALLAAALAGLAVLLGVLIANAISRSLRLLVRESERLRRLELEGGIEARSRFREIDEVLCAFEEARVGLRAFQRYVPVKLVRTLLAQQAEPHLGGEIRPLTIMFTDLREFTALAEGMDPAELARLLGAYFTAVTRAIHDHQGTVDKYIGDAVMAFWNAPQPVPAHARQACEAALELLAAVGRLERERPEAPRLQTRIGLHTAEVVVGNFGSEDRLNYTALGDGVNLAARLEALNKLLGTEVLASEATRAAAGEGLVFRRVALVAVKGRRRPVEVYELLGRAGEVEPARLARARRYEEALALYLERRWQQALAHFEQLLAEDPQDAAAREHAARCRALCEHEPGPDWDGALVQTSK
ncbi:MAG: hypothetical protein KatS3mg102_1600 [Planctomycetota bacterium]|nr:MAG: hypothetical protein KatS3mg102_1600 [Planctomycetota bacterium]